MELYGRNPLHFFVRSLLLKFLVYYNIHTHRCQAATQRRPWSARGAKALMRQSSHAKKSPAQHNEEKDVRKSEGGHVAPGRRQGKPLPRGGIELERNQACKRGNQGPQASHVHADKQGRCIRGKGVQEQGCGHIAYDLAAQERDCEFMAGNGPLQERLYGRKRRHVPRKYEEGPKGKQEHIVHGGEYLSIKKGQDQKYGRRRNAFWDNA